MTLALPRHPWRGRIGALLGILLMALSLRAAVVSVPPLLGSIRPELGLDALTIGVLAMLAPVIFAVSGLGTPRLIRWWGLERTLGVAVLLAVAGQLARAAVGGVPLFLLLSAVTMAGYGIGNVVLPPLVKKYFPDRLGVVTAGYVTLLAVGTAMAPQFSVPLAGVLGWRGSIAFWALASAVVLVPWTVQLARDRRARRGEGADGGAPVGLPHDAVGRPARPGAPGQSDAARPAASPLNPWRHPVAWGLAIFLAGNSAQTYVYFTWLPPYLVAQGLGEAAAGSALAYFAILGLPVALLVPLVVPRLRHPVLAVLLFTGCWATGHLGLYLDPVGATWAWITFAGLGQGTFAMALLMVNLRSRTTHGSGVLSGFSQGLGYAGAALVPMLFGVVRDATGGWGASFAMLAGCIAVMLVGAVMINGPRRIEDGPRVREPAPATRP